MFSKRRLAIAKAFPRHALPPSHTPQLSSIALPPQTPAQSATQSLVGSLSHISQLSSESPPEKTPLQSMKVDPSPLQIE